MDNNQKIRVHSGTLATNLAGNQTHPVNEVDRANAIVLKHVKEPTLSGTYYSNSPDFVMAMKYIAQHHGIAVEFFLNEESHGDDIEPIFHDFNRSIELIELYSGLQ